MSDCIVAKIHKGQRYPRVTVAGRVRFTHVVLWEEVHGERPEGMELHHTCGEKGCINVEHLALVTRSEHQKLHRRGPVCRNGLHAMTEENTYWSRRGERLCISCRSASQRAADERYRQRRRAAACH